MCAQSFCRISTLLILHNLFYHLQKNPKISLLDISIFPNQSSLLGVIHSPGICGRVRLLLALSDAEDNTQEKGTIPIRTYFSAFLY